MRIYDIIEKKRDGLELCYDEIKFFIDEYCGGSIEDYHAAALLMAIFLRGMNVRETGDLTEIMSRSGDVVDLSDIEGIKVDKHSTGGVGDKTTLILAPIVASCGVPVAKMSGRGLGHTGGTIDKLESIKGFNTDLTIDEFKNNVRKIGICIAGQTGNFVPADKKLYSLRNVTATVNSIPLIASSIMSKKIAAGADKIVLDVKSGSGAFMKTFEESMELARAMVRIGKHVGKTTVAVITYMDTPLGNAVGNSLEVIEAIEVLKGRGPEDLCEVSFSLASKMLNLAGCGDFKYCRDLVSDAINSGRALGKFAEMVKSQGGDTGVIDDYSKFGESFIKYEFTANEEGYVNSVKADSLGIASMMLGAGRIKKDDVIDYTAGIVLNKNIGMYVKKGECLATLSTSSRSLIDEAMPVLEGCFGIGVKPPKVRSLILGEVSEG